jgi:hypothetical protein
MKVSSDKHGKVQTNYLKHFVNSVCYGDPAKEVVCSKVLILFSCANHQSRRTSMFGIVPFYVHFTLDHACGKSFRESSGLTF